MSKNIWFYVKKNGSKNYYQLPGALGGVALQSCSAPLHNKKEKDNF